MDKVLTDLGTNAVFSGLKGGDDTGQLTVQS